MSIQDTYISSSVAQFNRQIEQKREEGKRYRDNAADQVDPVPFPREDDAPEHGFASTNCRRAWTIVTVEEEVEHAA